MTLMESDLQKKCETISEITDVTKRWKLTVNFSRQIISTINFFVPPNPYEQHLKHGDATDLVIKISINKNIDRNVTL